MSKITNDCLARSGTGCFYSCTHMATVGIKGLMYDVLEKLNVSGNMVIKYLFISCLTLIDCR